MALKEIVLGRQLSFENPIGEDASFLLSESCHYKESTNTLYVQAPKMDDVQSVLNPRGFMVVLGKDAVMSYDALKRVHVTTEPSKKRFIIKLPEYPSYPLFNNNNVKKWTWKNLVRRLNEREPLYEAKHLFQLMEAIEWLEREGYIISKSDAVLSYFPPGLDTVARIASMTRDPELVLEPHQIECLLDMERMKFKGIVGDHAGMGKSITGGEIIWKLWNAGMIKRVLWIVPTSPLVTQVSDEMKNRYGLTGKMVTGETIKPLERLGISKGEEVDVTIYEKHGFVITTWSMFVRDFSGKMFHDLTKRVHFDLVIMDEGHRSLYGNKAFEAVLNMSAPYRVMLSGTIMPNGKWEELHDMVSSISPSSVMAKWFFKNIEEKKTQDYAVEEREYPEHDARMDITKMVLAMLMKRVTLHSKEEYSGALPKLAETSMHVPLNEKEEIIVENMIDMLSQTIKDWKAAFPWKTGSKKQKEYYYMIESAKNVLWQDLRRFCSHGAFHLERRMNEITTNPSSMHDWVSTNFPKQIAKIKSALASGSVRMQPKNEKVLSILDQAKPERCLVFYDSVRGCIDLAKYLKDNDHNVKVIVGSDDQFSDEDGDLLEQTSNITDAAVEELIEWFWFPWKTISKISSFDDALRVTYTGEDGKARDRIYYVTAHRLGSEITINVEWDEPISPGVVTRIRGIVDEIAASPAFVIDAEIPKNHRAPGRIVIAIKKTKHKDRRVLVTTDKLNEGANLQIANMILFYDHPLSIKQKEQRIARSRRMESMHPVIGVVTILMGLDYAIERTLERKYETAQRLGYPDPTPVSMKEVLEMVKRKEPPKKEVDLMDFLGGE